MIFDANMILVSMFFFFRWNFGTRKSFSITGSDMVPWTPRVPEEVAAVVSPQKLAPEIGAMRYKNSQS